LLGRLNGKVNKEKGELSDTAIEFIEFEQQREKKSWRKKKRFSQVLVAHTLLLATQEAEIRRIAV
jgi:hypothetical protein